MDTSEQLRAARAVLSLTRAQLGELAGVSSETIKKMENGKGAIDGTTRILGKLQTALEAQGVVFVPANGGPAGIRYAAPGGASE